MTVDKRLINVGGIDMEVVRKKIKNVNLRVYPPDGRVRISAPISMSDKKMRLAIVDMLPWIRRHQAKFEVQARPSSREMVSDESHYFLGQRYRLNIVDHNGAGKVELRDNSFMDLCLRPECSAGQREQVLQRWYRDQLRALVPPLLTKWQPALGVQAAEWRIKKMKTRWGSCNCTARRVWFNLELAKKPPQCLEYVVVHELAHLLERRHNNRFKTILDGHLPLWRQLREELNRTLPGPDS
ncbi:MAG: SprT family zinc-dependent metalloprotease [Dehalococcoidia bacterium]|nr:SprT family zinc-dependent metalloprotease [Dehalococcoidia bacterium]